MGKIINLIKIQKIINLILFITSISLIVNLIKLNLLSNKYLIIIILIITFLNFFILLIQIIGKNNSIRIINIILSIIIILFLIFELHMGINKVDNFLKKITKQQEEIYLIIVNKDSSSDIKDYRNSYFGFLSYDKDNSLKVVSLLKNDELYKNEANSFQKLFNKLTEREIDFVIVRKSYTNLIEKQGINLKRDYKIIKEIKLSTSINLSNKNIDLSKDSFIIYISGIDQFDDSDKLKRSDVNQLIVVNLKTKRILMLNTQRDIFIKLHGIDAKDKLNQAALYGIDMSVKTLEDLYDIDINYYIRIDFNLLINLVNSINGIEVNNDIAFKGHNGTDFKKGLINLNGKEALEYVRTRKSLPNGDTGRGYHQQLVIEAIANKIISTNFLFNYQDILNSLQGEITTNLNQKEISSLLKMQLDKMPVWNIENFNVNGEKFWYDYTYTLPTVKDYVMDVNTELLLTAKEKINKIMEEK